MHLDQMVRWLALVHAIAFFGGCTAVPIPTAETATKGNWTWTDSVEVSNLISVYQLQEAVQTMTESGRANAIREITSIPLESRSVAQHLQLSLLLGAVDPNIADYNGAQDALEMARDLVHDKPLLVAHINALKAQFGKVSQMRLTLDHLSRENDELHRTVTRLREQRVAAVKEVSTAGVRKNSETPLAQAAAQADAKANEKSSAVGTAGAAAENANTGADADATLSASGQSPDPWVAELSRAQMLLRLAREELKKRDLTINEQGSKITVLEAKIKALSAIERNLNQREDQLNRDIKNEAETSGSAGLEARGDNQQDRILRE